MRLVWKKETKNLQRNVNRVTLEETMKPIKITPQHLRVFRAHFGLTQRTAADYLGITRATWNRWEQGKVEIPQHMIYTLKGLRDFLKENI
jgi:DNA-binding XRE family transcriptional regulator